MEKKTIYALGFFDGVHTGHQALLKACRLLAREMGAKAGVLTFENHPSALLAGSATGLLTTPAERKRLFLEQGMEEILCLPFDKALQQMSWQAFYSLLRQRYGAGGFVCGEDFRFGAGGKGTALLLQEKCRQDGLPCTVVPQQKIGEEAVSSSKIRRLLEAGDVKKANLFLGRPHRLTGQVLPGKQLGRTIGIPTANIPYPVQGVQLPYGVYAALAWVDGKSYRAVTNIGTRPTVNGQGVTVESWLEDFTGDLYGKEISLEFFAYLRPEQKFGALGELKAQIAADRAAANEILGNTGC